MRKVTGAVLLALAVIAGIGAYVGDLTVAYKSGGLLLLIVAVALTPATMVVVPFYAVIAHRNWAPLVLSIMTAILHTGYSKTRNGNRPVTNSN
jgi:hypothetical protein